MTHEERNKRINYHFGEIMKIAGSKGVEYSVNEDANGNFKSDIEIGVDPIQSCGVLMNKHYRAVRSFIKHREVKSEPIEGRIHDLALYSFILLTLIEEQYGKNI